MKRNTLLSNGFKNVFVVDISPFAIANIKKRVPNFPSNQLFNIDFFKLTGTFDLIVEQTFFCAIDKNLRICIRKENGRATQLGRKIGRASIRRSVK